ncbi:class I SAM-dependent DNA methyltransferase [Vibrio penaeicida]|uniref:Methyltransferase n=1 Tax=Vibrio penaeicida TaxID=104609 RepID=A0AAV5NUM5_9VIBR|nr:class I SAM-dependent methyltransferase [Vibrio penaeicida]MDP2575139.1 class I SAM-dependent methyltransferase [Vibrio penaeicida]RTZ21605.1 class I SAM-dependent methyltransferase [Vibrio penaeicida]GLQ73984.1 methyltransferase [Vibrio penaeicida]
MSNEWDEYAENWEQDAATANYAQKAFEQLEERVSLEGLKVLDFGCGTGLLTQKLSPLAKEIVALDSSEKMIEQLDAKELLNVEPVVDELTRGLVAYHPAFRGQFDIVVASSVCGFLDDFEESAKIIHSLLNDGGLFIHWDWLVDSDSESYGLTQSQAKKALTKAKFSSVTIDTPFHVDSDKGSLPVLMGVAQK